MKLIQSMIIMLVSLLATSTLAQDCDSLFVGDGGTMTGNESPLYTGTMQYRAEFLYGKLETITYSPKWVSSIGFETSIIDSNICHAGIILSNGMLVIFRTFPGSSVDCPLEPQFKKLYPVPG